MISSVKKLTFIKNVLLCALACHSFMPIIAMQEYPEAKWNYTEKCPLLPYPSSVKHLTVDLKKTKDDVFSLSFDNAQPCKINYQFDGSSVAQLFTNGNDVLFEGVSPHKHNFSFAHLLKAGMLAINTQGKFIFEQPVNVEAARLTCETIELSKHVEFSSAKECLLAAQYVNNNGNLKCSDLLFRGDRLYCMPEGSFTISDSAFVAAVRGFFNDGRFSCTKEMVVEAPMFKNLGSLETGGLNCAGDKVINTGVVTIRDYFCGDCKTFDNQSKWNVQKNFLLKSKEFFSKRDSRLYVGGDLKATVDNLYFSGCTSVDNLVLLNVRDHATLAAPFYARILYLDSKGFIDCHCLAEFVIGHHLGFKAKGFITYSGRVFEKFLDRQRDASFGKKVDPLLEMFPHGVFLYSEKGSLKKSGSIIARDGTICLGANGRLTHTGLTEAGFCKDSQLLMNAEDLIFEKKSVLKSGYAQLIAKSNLHHEGSIEAKQHLQMRGSHVMQHGAVNVGDILTINAGDISAGALSLMRSKMIVLEAETKISNQGIIAAEQQLAMGAATINLGQTSEVQAPIVNLEVTENITNQGSIKAEHQLAMKATAIDLGKTSHVQAPIADLKAKQQISNQGSIEAEDKLAIRSDIVTNNGSIAAGNAQVNANNMWWNGGKVSAQEGLIVNAYTSLNTWNSIIEARDYRRRCVYGWEMGSCTAQNNDLNSIVACNLGVIRPGNWSFKNDICSSNNLWNVGKTVGIMGLSYACPPIGTTLGVISALYGLSQFGNRFAAIQAEEAALGETREISDLIPIYCQKKDLAISTILSAATVYRAGLGARDYYNRPLPIEKELTGPKLKEFMTKALGVHVEPRSIFKNLSELVIKGPAVYAQPDCMANLFDVTTCVQHVPKIARDSCTENNFWRAGEVAFAILPNKFHWLHAPFAAIKFGRITYRDWDTFFKAIDGSVNAVDKDQQDDASFVFINPDFGPNVKTLKGLAPGLIGMLDSNNSGDSLFNLDVSSTLGVSGSSRSLFTMNGGSSLFASGYTLDTGYGVNTGTLGALNLNINAVETYNTCLASLLCGMTGSVTAKNLALDGSMWMENQLTLEAKNNIRLGGHVHSKATRAKGRKVVLQEGSLISGGTSHVAGDTVVPDGNIDVTGQSVLQSNNKMCVKGNIHAGNSIIQANGVHLQEGSLISGGESCVVADTIIPDGNIHVAGKSVLKSSNKMDVKGKIHAGASIIQAKEVHLQEGSQISGGASHVAGSAVTHDGHIKVTGQSVLQANEKVRGEGKIHAGTSIIQAKEIHLQEGSEISGGASHVAGNAVTHDGNINVTGQSVLDAKEKVTVRGKTHAAGTYIQGKEADLQKTSEISGGQAAVTADIVDADGKFNLSGHLGMEAKKQLTMNTQTHVGSALIKAPEVLLKKDNSIEAIANGDQAQQGAVVVRADNVTNYGSIEAKNAQVNANKMLWNGGKISAQEGVEINAYKLVGTCNSVVNAKYYKRNCFLAFDIGSRTTQHSDLNSMIALDAGVLRSGNWTFKDDVFTWNNAFNVGIMGASYACPPLGVGIGAVSSCYQLLCIPNALAGITQAEDELNKRGNVEFSDRIPIYCKQKNLALSTLASVVTIGRAGVGVWNYFNHKSSLPPVKNVELKPGEVDALELRRILYEKQYGTQSIKSSYSPYQVLTLAHKNLCGIMSKNQAAQPINPPYAVLHDLRARAIMGNDWARPEPLHVVPTTSDFKFGGFINNLVQSAEAIRAGIVLNSATCIQDAVEAAHDACTEDNLWSVGEVAFTLAPAELHWLHAPFAAVKMGRNTYRCWNKSFQSPNTAINTVSATQQDDAAVTLFNPDFGANLKTIKALAPGLLRMLDSHQSGDALLNLDFSSALGISGSSRSLFTMNGGSAVFAGGYTLDTGYGINTGTLGAMNLNVNSATTYCMGQGSLLCGITGSVTAKNIDNHGNINMIDTITLHATDRVRMYEGATTKAKIVAIKASSLQGAKENVISSTEQTHICVSHIDNKGTINGPVVLDYTGSADQLTNIGRVDNLQYSGTLENNLADRLAKGQGDLLHVNQGGSVTLCAGNQDVHLKEQHDMSHAFKAETQGNIYVDKQITSQESINLHGKNVTHDSVLANHAVDIDASQSVIARSKVERQGDGVNYQDTVKQVVVRGGDSTRVHAENGHIDYKGVKIGSGKGGTLVMADNGKVITDAVYAEKHTQEHHLNQKHGEKTCTQKTSTTSHVSEFDSEGLVVIHAGDTCELTGTKFNAQGGVRAYGAHGVNGYDAQDVCKSTVDYKKDGGRMRTTKESHVDTVTSIAKPVEFNGGIAPTITSDEKIVLSCTNNAATITLNAPEVQCLLSKNVKCSNSTNASNNLFWKSEKSDQQVDVTAGPTFQGSINTNAQKFYIEQVNERASAIINNSNVGGEITHTLFDEIHNKQVHRKRGPTKAASAVIAMAVTFATAGFGSAAGATVATAVGCKSALATAMVTNMTSATVTSLSVLVTDALLTNGGDINAAARSLAKTNTLKFVALSALTAGAVTRAGQAFNQMGLPAVQSATNLGQRIAYAAPRQMANAAIRTASAVAAGQEFKDAVKQNLRYAAAGTVGTACASQIGDAYAKGEIDPITHKLLHTAVGAAEGAIIGGASGAVAGGLGAAVAETVADVSAPTKPSIGKIKELEVVLGRPFTQEEFMQHWNDQARAYMQAVCATAASSQLAAGTVALLVGQDVAIASDAAARAIDNNFFVLAAYGFAAAGVAYSAYNIYSAYETEGEAAALKQLGIEVSLEVAGLAASRVAGKVLYKVGKATYPTAKAAIDSVLQSNPGLGCALGSMVDKIIIGAEKVNQTALGKAVHNIEAALLEQESKLAARFGFNCAGAAESELARQEGPNEIVNEIINAKRTGSALKKDAHHAFSDLVDNCVGQAKKFELIGDDKKKRFIFQIEGSLEGVDGIFEWILEPENQLVTHRLFIKGGRVTGKANVWNK